MASNESGFRSLFASDNNVDLPKLRDVSKHGVPPKLRVEVWKFLLGVNFPDRSDELKHQKRMKEEFDLLSSRTNGQQTSVAKVLSRFHFKPSHDVLKLLFGPSLLSPSPLPSSPKKHSMTTTPTTTSSSSSSNGSPPHNIPTVTASHISNNHFNNHFNHQYNTNNHQNHVFNIHVNGRSEKRNELETEKENHRRMDEMVHDENEMTATMKKTKKKDFRDDVVEILSSSSSPAWPRQHSSPTLPLDVPFQLFPPGGGQQSPISSSPLTPPPDPKAYNSNHYSHFSSYSNLNMTMTGPSLTPFECSLAQQQQVVQLLKERLQRVMNAYLNNNPNVPFEKGLLNVLLPLVIIFPVDHECFFCFEAVMKLIHSHFDETRLAEIMSTFRTSFRCIQPELFNHFEEEEVEINWAMDWFHFMLATALPLECTFRLWDTYFSCEEGPSLHFHVCLAILNECSELLLDHEGLEIKSLLQNLPKLNMDKIIAQAYNLKNELNLPSMAL